MSYYGKNLLCILIVISVYVRLVPQAAKFDLISHSMLSQWHFWRASNSC